MHSQRAMKIFIMTAIIACIGTFIGDILMLAAPMSGSEYFFMYKKTMTGISTDRLLWGNTLGLLVALQLFGYYAAYLLLKKNNNPLALIFFFSLSFSMLSGLAYHCSFAFYGTGLQVHAIINNETTAGMMRHFELYHRILYGLMGFFFALGSLAFMILVLRGTAVFKKWHSLINPLFILILVRFLLELIPAPLGGYIAPGYGNITAIIFFIFLAIILMKRKWKIFGE